MTGTPGPAPIGCAGPSHSIEREVARDRSPRVVVVAANCSLRMGGEAAIPFQLFRRLLARGVDVHLVAHDRNRRELEEYFASDWGRIHLVEDDAFSIWAARSCGWMSGRLKRGTIGVIADLIVQSLQQRVIRRLVAEHRVDVVHQCYPVSPAEPSLLRGLGVPIVIGPMNGGMEYPPGFRDREGLLERGCVHLGRSLRHIANLLFSGKREADVLLVANDRSRRALPGGLRGDVFELAENGVDMSLWENAAEPGQRGVKGEVRFAYIGRLVDWKGIDLLLEAWSRLPSNLGAKLELIGDGVLRQDLEAYSERLGLSGAVSFTGFLPAEECARRLARSDALVLPSLIECGGAVVLEAMASGLPVIATAWGGPLDYIDSSSGILVPANSRDEFLDGLIRAVERLSGSAELRRDMGDAARRRAASYDWEAKVDRFLEIYQKAIAARRSDSREPGKDWRAA